MFPNKKFDEIEAMLIGYFKDQVKDQPRYFKAKHIVQDIKNLSSNKVGTCLSIMCDKSPKKMGGFKITNYSYANATTWRVERVC